MFSVSVPGLKFVDNLSPVEDEGFSRAEGIMVSFLGLFFFHYVDQIDFTLPNTNKHLNFPIVWFWSQRKGVSHGQNTGFQGRNNRFSNRVGPMRRQNNHINNKGKWGHSRVHLDWELGSESQAEQRMRHLVVFVKFEIKKKISVNIFFQDYWSLLLIALPLSLSSQVNTGNWTVWLSLDHSTFTNDWKHRKYCCFWHILVFFSHLHLL